MAEPYEHELQTIGALIAQRDGAAPDRLHLRRYPLRGGLVAASIDHVTAHYVDADGAERSLALVVKRLAGAAAREASVYERVVAPAFAELAPQLYHVQRIGSEEILLYLEALQPVSTWPWQDRRAAQLALATAGRLHQHPIEPQVAEALREWDHDGEQRATAALTLQLLEQLRRQRGAWIFGGALRWTRRVVETLPALRAQLLAFQPFGTAVVHGDLHSGNVVLREGAERHEALLLDWGRTRLGSPLEDVSSWLQSLGAWEPEARRRHDTLFVGYLAARGLEPRLDAHTRAAYWLAGASNALSGALLYHLSVILDARVPSEGRAAASYAAREWVRIIRRADHFWS